MAVASVGGAVKACSKIDDDAAASLEEALAGLLNFLAISVSFPVMVSMCSRSDAAS